MYFFRNTGPRIPTPQHHSRNAEAVSEASETIMNPDGSIRSGKKRKAHDIVATSYIGLPMGVPTALVAHARCEPFDLAFDDVPDVPFQFAFCCARLPFERPPVAFDCAQGKASM